MIVIMITVIKEITLQNHQNEETLYSVSYTHLDVYKRQSCTPGINPSLCSMPYIRFIRIPYNGYEYR